MPASAATSTLSSGLFVSLIALSGYFVLPWLFFRLKRASAAQTCNEDVLRLIFEHCSDSTLASAGRVCRSWVDPAQRELFSILPPKRSQKRTMSWKPLGTVLLSNPRLRSYIRRLKISVMGMKELDNYDWVRLLPYHGITSLELSSWPNDQLHAALGNMFLTSPGLSNLQQLTIAGAILTDPAVSQKFLSNPSLSHLQLVFLGGPAPSQPFSPAIAAQSLLIEDAPAMIWACRASLRRLDLHLKHNPDPTGYARLAAALQAVPHLEHIHFDWDGSSTLHGDPTPVLDGLGLMLPNLRHLRAGAGLYTAARIFPAGAAIADLSTHPTLRSFTLSPAVGCPFMEFPVLIAASKSFRFEFATPAKVEESYVSWD
ncbi:hypothetical protein B0H14DRAFT_2681742 [Mycena olivaceomarginata]|nr:hypothetical protein B0H14DRAFT_2681742 [Mycena olivaceomarginata]